MTICVFMSNFHPINAPLEVPPSSSVILIGRRVTSICRLLNCSEHELGPRGLHFIRRRRLFAAAPPPRETHLPLERLFEICSTF